MSDTELLLKSEPVRRVEVFTGAGRRRTWTAEEKASVSANLKPHATGQVARRAPTRSLPAAVATGAMRA